VHIGFGPHDLGNTGSSPPAVAEVHEERAVWRRACLGSRDDVWTLAAMWGAFVVSVCLIVADTASWWQGLEVAVAIVLLPWLPFRVRRRHWDRVVDAEFARCLTQAERLLKES
jgi:hypothetical protein